jgi:predicted AlkP superfamily phosphohydrolase/phosphomutase
MATEDMWGDLSEEDRDVVLRMELAGYPPDEALHVIWSTRLEPDLDVSTAVSSVLRRPRRLTIM